MDGRAHPPLRLVGSTARPAVRASRPPVVAVSRAHEPFGQAAERSRVRAENQSARDSAAGLEPHDARWILAARTSEVMGERGLLTHEQREGLQRLASRMGLRQFDATLVLAIVQDAARRGEAPLNRDVASRLSRVSSVEPRASVAGERWPRWSAVAVFVLASIMFWAMVYWLTGSFA